MDANKQRVLASLAVAGMCWMTAAAQSPGGTWSRQSKPTVRHHRVPAEDASEQLSPSVAQAEAALEKKDYLAAEELLLTATAGPGADYRAWFDLGRVYTATGRKAEAIEAYKKSLSAKPDLFESNLNLGLLLASMGAPAEARQYLTTATRLQPSMSADQERFTAWMALADVLRSDAPQKSLDAYQEAEKLRPSDFEPHLRIAQLLAEKNDYSEAQKEFQRAIELNPVSEEALAGLVELYAKEKKPGEVEALLRLYLAAHPESAAAHVRLAQALEAQEKYDAAQTELETALKSSVTPALRRELAGLAAMRKNYLQAEIQYRALLKDEPDGGDLHYQLGTVLMDEHKFPEAEQELLAAVQRQPSLAEAYGNLATVASENQHYQLALKALDARARLLPENAGTYFLRATSYDHLRDFKKASESYRQFLAAAQGKFPNQEWQARHRLIAIDPKR